MSIWTQANWIWCWRSDGPAMIAGNWCGVTGWFGWGRRALGGGTGAADPLPPTEHHAGGGAGGARTGGTDVAYCMYQREFERAAGGLSGGPRGYGACQGG